jgi:peptidoglycan/xylan/chitin deacetylase (PgdA/CDA1 family)
MVAPAGLLVQVEMGMDESHTPGRVLRIAYRAVGSTWASPRSMPESTLFTQLRMLRDRGYVGLTFSDAERRIAEGTLPQRAVVVTFDGGHHSVLRAAAALNCVGFPATVFVVTGFVESGRPMRWPGVEAEPGRHMRSLGWADLERLAEAGWEVGSHTVSHACLTDADEGVLDEQLGGSRQAIAARLGGCRSVSYPYGIADHRVARAAADAGYAGGCTLAGAHLEDGPFLRSRVELTAADTGLRLRVQLRRRRGLAARQGRGLRRRRARVAAG